MSSSESRLLRFPPAVDPQIFCVGECLVDVMPSGKERSGGAPANVAFHAACAGVDAALVSRTGNDARGHELRRSLLSAGLSDELLQTDRTHPTGLARVILDGETPRYDIDAPAAWDFISDSARASAAARRSACVVFGTLAQRHPESRATIRSLVAEARASGAAAVADLNLRPPFFDGETVLWTLRHADLLKLNCEELSAVSQLLGATGETMALFEGLVREFGLRRAVLTRGAAGAWFFAEGRAWHQPAVSCAVTDAVGAGDAFTAVLASAVARDVPLEQAGPVAAEVAAHVVSQAGAMPAWPRHLAESARRILRAAG